MTVRVAPVARVGSGRAVGHHGEILQGAFTINGGLVRALVTLPYAASGSSATFKPVPGLGVIVEPVHKSKARQAARLTVTALGVRCGGHLRITSNIPEKLGLGSSTTDVVAAIRATADAFGVEPTPEVIATLAVEAEGASDPLMYVPRCVMFAHREGRVLEDFGRDLPRLAVAGVVAGKGVGTLTFPPARYSEFEIRRFGELHAQLRRAIAHQDRAGVADVATASGRINQRFLPLGAYEALEAIVDRTGGLGLQVAHSGAAVGLLYDPVVPDLRRRIAAAARQLDDVGLGLHTVFDTTIGNAHEEEAA